MVCHTTLRTVHRSWSWGAWGGRGLCPGGVEVDLPALLEVPKQRHPDRVSTGRLQPVRELLPRRRHRRRPALSPSDPGLLSSTQHCECNTGDRRQGARTLRQRGRFTAAAASASSSTEAPLIRWTGSMTFPVDFDIFRPAYSRCRPFWLTRIVGGSPGHSTQPLHFPIDAPSRTKRQAQCSSTWQHWQRRGQRGQAQCWQPPGALCAMSCGKPPGR